MGDHFVLLVDRLLTESTLEAAIESKNQLQLGMPSASKHDIIDFSSTDDNVGSSPRKLVECRICHDDDEDLNMEIPCSCRGSLKVSTKTYMLNQDPAHVKLNVFASIAKW